jgi:hypothetical protein
MHDETPLFFAKNLVFNTRKRNPLADLHHVDGEAPLLEGEPRQHLDEVPLPPAHGGQRWSTAVNGGQRGGTHRLDQLAPLLLYHLGQLAHSPRRPHRPLGRLPHLRPHGMEEAVRAPQRALELPRLSN